MKLANIEIDNRIDVALNKSFKSDDNSGIMTFGENNDYPQIIEKLILSSKTGKASRGIFAKFIAGSGFENEQIGSVIVGKNEKGQDIILDDIRRKLALSIATYGGGYIHANMTIEGIVTDTKIVSFKDCRFTQVDDIGNTGKVAVYNNWTKEYSKKIDKNKITYYNHFNTNRSVLLDNIEKAGGIDNFKGQIYSFASDDEYLYPLSPFDSVYLDCDSEYQIQLFKNREIRNGFSDKIILLVSEPDDEIEQDVIENKVKGLMGADGEKIIMFYTSFDDETGDIDKDGAFKLEKITTNINDKLFVEWEKSLSNSIRKAAKALPAVLIDYEQGQLSQASGEMIKQAVNYYNALISHEREVLESAIKDVYSNFKNDLLSDNINWNIKPLQLT